MDSDSNSDLAKIKWLCLKVTVKANLDPEITVKSNTDPEITVKKN